MFRSVNGEISAVVQSNTRLVSHKINVRFLLTDVLCPRTFHSNNRTGRADKRRNGIVYVISAVKLRRTGPHVGIGVILYITAELAEGFSGNGLGDRVAAAVHYNIEVMHAPVNQRAAARNCLGGKRAAKPRDGTVRAERRMNMINIAQLTVIDKLFNQIHTVIKAVYHTDIQYFTGFMLCLLHLKRLCIGSCRRLFAQNILACVQAVDGDRRVHVVGRTN